MTLAQQLGFSEDTKLLIIHADDAGLSHSENRATIQSLEQGLVNSYSMMVPCPWFYEMAVYSRNNPRNDYGIHLTLTCEWENYRFGPILPVSEVPSLVDEHGHFYKKRDQLREKASAPDVYQELTAQIEKAIRLGLTPTHIDAHMYSVGSHPDFFNIYRSVGERFDLPVLINHQMMQMVGMNAEENIKEGDLVIDHTYVAESRHFETGRLGDYYRNVLENLTAGINLILIHPAFDDDEMKGVTVNHPNYGSEWRQQDFDFFTNDNIKSLLKEQRIELITWRDIHARSKLRTNV